MGAGFIAFWAWIASLEYLLVSRIMFAWGMDRMGPKWFTNVSPRFASPVSNYLFILVAGEVFITLFVFLFYDTVVALNWTTIDLVFVLLITGLSALVFPFVKKVRGIWDSSPFRTWSVIGLPAITLGAIVYLAYVAILVVWLLVLPQNRSVGLNSLYAFCVIWALAIFWYFFWSGRSKKAGVDTSMTYGELPPD
jgi:amino acid transporter